MSVTSASTVRFHYGHKTVLPNNYPAPWLLRKNRSGGRASIAGHDAEANDVEAQTRGYVKHADACADDKEGLASHEEANDGSPPDQSDEKLPDQNRLQTITWAPDLKQPNGEKTFRVPPPQQRDNGAPLQEVDDITSDDDDVDKISVANASTSGGLRRRNTRRLSSAATSMSIERIASSMFVLGDTQEIARSRSREPSTSRHTEGLRKTASSMTDDRRSNIRALSKEELGGIEYRSLWLLLKIIVGQYSAAAGTGPALTD